MKKDIHPKEYRYVVFKDVSCDYAFLSRSTANSRDTIVWTDGKEYPLIKLEISDKTHPFFTGKMKFVDTAGRVDKFFAKYGKRNQTVSDTSSNAVQKTDIENKKDNSSLQNNSEKDKIKAS